MVTLHSASDGRQPNEYAAKAVAALGVNGVMILDANAMEYCLYTGALGTGQAKASGRSIFKLNRTAALEEWRHLCAA